MQDIQVWGPFPAHIMVHLESLGYELQQLDHLPAHGKVLVYDRAALAFQRAALRAQRFPTAFILYDEGELPPDWRTYFDGHILMQSVMTSQSKSLKAAADKATEAALRAAFSLPEGYFREDVWFDDPALQQIYLYMQTKLGQWCTRSELAQQGWPDGNQKPSKLESAMKRLAMGINTPTSAYVLIHVSHKGWRLIIRHGLHHYADESVHFQVSIGGSGPRETRYIISS